jgi:hypothetical protein
MRSTCVAFLAAVCAAPGAGAGGPSGSYEIDAVLEIPNIGMPAWSGRRTVCLGSAADGLPMPLLSPNHPFAGCAPRDLERSGTALRYRIVCPGRDAARAVVAYELRPEGFTGEIAMVLGAKNMTLTERQVGRREGGCAEAAAAGR